MVPQESLKKLFFIILSFLAILLSLSIQSYAVVVSPSRGQIYMSARIYFGYTDRHFGAGDGTYSFTNAYIGKAFYPKVRYDSDHYISLVGATAAKWQTPLEGNMRFSQSYTVKNYSPYKHPAYANMYSRWWYYFNLSSPAMFSLDFTNNVSYFPTNMLRSPAVSISKYSSGWQRIMAESLSGSSGHIEFIIQDPGYYWLSVTCSFTLNYSNYGYRRGSRFATFNWKLEDPPAPVPEPSPGVLFLLYGISSLLINRKSKSRTNFTRQP